MSNLARTTATTIPAAQPGSFFFAITRRSRCQQAHRLQLRLQLVDAIAHIVDHGRLTAVDVFIVQDNGPYEKQYDHDSAASICSLAYQPEAMRFRGISVLTNTPPRTYQRSPGGMQANAIVEPILANAAKQLGIDQVEMHRVNAPAGKAASARASARNRNRFSG